jgi:hypothetical protein
MMMQHVGFADAAYVRRMVEILGERGVVDCPEGQPPRLTAKGREFYGLKRPASEKEKIIVVREPTENERNGETRTRAKRYPVEERAKQLCEALAEAKREKGSLNYCPFFAELAPRIGYRAVDGSGAISRAAQKAVELGWIASYGHNKKHALQFTEEGLREFMPEFAAPPRDSVTSHGHFNWSEPLIADSLIFRQAEPEPEPEPFDYRRNEEIQGTPAWERATLQGISTGEIVMALIERGYIVRKG